MNLQKQKEKYPHLEQRLSRLEKDAKICEIMLSLKEHEGVKILLDELEQIIKTINNSLLSYEKLTTEEREKLLVDKQRCLWLIEKFPGYELRLENINRYIEKL